MKRYTCLLLTTVAVFYTNGCNRLFSPEPLMSSPALSTEIAEEQSPISSSPLELFTDEAFTELECILYLETAWGDGPTQWGGSALEVVYPPVFDEAGRIYFPDYSNRRFLVYSGQDPNPIQIIDLPEKYFESEGYLWPSPRPPYISPTHIFVPYAYDRLSVLSLEGQEEDDFRLPLTFALLTPAWNSVLIDSQGGLFMNGVGSENQTGLHYFSRGWENGNWSEVSYTETAIMSPQIWGEYLVSQGSRDGRFVIALRKIDVGTDFLNAPPLYLEPPLTATANVYWLKGIDRENWAYIEDSSEYPVIAFVRYSLTGHSIQRGLLPLETTGQVIQSSVAPDGNIYLVTYIWGNPSSPPQMHRCRFP